jgi:hypothetical protein
MELLIVIGVVLVIGFFVKKSQNENGVNAYSVESDTDDTGPKIGVREVGDITDTSLGNREVGDRLL